MDSLGEELLKGLDSSPKYLPVWYKYDKEGSRLYGELIKHCEWYYYPKQEVKLLKELIKDAKFLKTIASYPVLVDLGCGNAFKTRILLDKMVHRVTYVPVDISEEHLHETSDSINKDYGDKIVIDRMPMGYFEALDIVSKRYKEDRKLVVWFNGPMNLSYEEQIRHLTNISNHLKDGDRLLVTVDITSHERKKVIELAYNDPKGYNARFYTNSIRRLNKDFKGDIDISKFQLKSEFIAETSTVGFSYVNVWLEAIENCCFFLEKLNKRLKFKEEEKFYLHSAGGVTSKYTMDQIRNIIHQSSLKIENYWTNKNAAVLVLYT